MQFKEIPGLENTKNLLIKGVQSNHIAHAQLFHGPQGGAQLAMAFAYAAFLFCTNRTETDSCGVCPACQKIHKGIHPDVVYVFPTFTITKKIDEPESDLFLGPWRNFIQESPYRTVSDWLEFAGAEGNKQGLIPVRETRKLLSKISIKPYEAPYRVIIIWNPESFNMESGNALLKPLEEPPSNAIFLLVTSDIQKLLLTIISRTQRITIPMVEENHLRDFLENKFQIDPEKAHQIVVSSEGNISLACEKANSENTEMSNWFIDWFRAIYRKNLVSLVKLADIFDKMSKEDQKALMEYSLYIFRQSLYQWSGNENLITSFDKERNFIRNFAVTVNPDMIEKFSEKISEVFYQLERNARAKILHLDLSLQLIRIHSQFKQ
ncbi:MAG: DNA-directed polymerase [Bacteroidota bacterium]|jgi:DNA polymerase-3 subunit delta'